jgi:hypothetical protein
VLEYLVFSKKQGQKPSGDDDAVQEWEEPLKTPGIRDVICRARKITNWWTQSEKGGS